MIWGASQEETTWAELDDLLRTTWPHPNGGTLRIDAAVIDAGDGEIMDRVIGFCRPRFGRRVVAGKGVTGTRQAISASHSKTKLFIIGVDGLKSQILTRLGSERSVRFSDSLEPSWFEQLALERRVVRYVRGQPLRRFERVPGRRAETLDCVVYAFAARHLVTADLDRREAELGSAAAPATQPSVIRSAWLGR